MCRPPRVFKAESFELEGRWLLAIGPFPPAPAVNPQPVSFVGAAIPGTSDVSQTLTQQDGEATVLLSRYVIESPGLLTPATQVVVTTDPSSPAVGVNVGTVDQTVTFAENQAQAIVKVPIFAGAPNPGEVDVDLTLTPINSLPYAGTPGRMKLRVLASGAKNPPTIDSVRRTSRGFVLKFNKPLDPAGASNVMNYAVGLKWVSISGVPDIGFIRNRSRVYVESVPLQSAQYDPVTQTVTIVPRRKQYSSGSYFVVQGQKTKDLGRPGHQSKFGPGLTDLVGNPINADTTPGKFRVRVT